MSRGERIRRYRKLKGWNQTILGEKVGVGQTAIRNYERDLRVPTPDMLQAIADALEVPVTSLEDYEFKSAREALEALFRLEEGIGLKPTRDGGLTIDPDAKNAKKLDAAIRAWREVLDEVESGDMSQGDYERWKASLK